MFETVRSTSARIPAGRSSSLSRTRVPSTSMLSNQLALVKRTGKLAIPQQIFHARTSSSANNIGMGQRVRFEAHTLGILVKTAPV